MSYILYCFTADWCKPCKQMREPLLGIKSQYPEVDFEYVNIDYDINIDMINKYNIKSIPSYILVKNLQEVSRVEGAKIDKVEELLRLCH